MLFRSAMPIDASASLQALASMGRPLGMDAVELARGIVSVVVSNSTGALHAGSVRRGLDPRDFVLMAYGGCGPLHAGLLARELAIPIVVVPPSPGILCAYGLLVADVADEIAQTRIVPAGQAGANDGERILARLEEQARDWLDRQRVPVDQWRITRSVDMRYRGQNYELRVPLDGALDDGGLRSLVGRFHQRHETRYGHHAPDDPVELVTFRVQAAGKRATTPIAVRPRRGHPSTPRTERVVHLLASDERWPVYERPLLVLDQEIGGPAIVEQLDTTTLILPGQSARVDEQANLVLEFRESTG